MLYGVFLSTNTSSTIFTSVMAVGDVLLNRNSSFSTYFDYALFALIGVLAFKIFLKFLNK